MSVLTIKKQNAYTCLNLLWNGGFFRVERNLNEISKEITTRWDHNFSSIEICKALKKAKFLRCLGKRGAFRYIQKTNSVSKNIQNIEGWQVPHILDTVVQTVWVDLGR